MSWVPVSHSRGMRIAAATAVAATMFGGAAVAGAPTLDPTDGSSGMGDPYYPNDGNGGYDVADYKVVYAMKPGGVVNASTTVTAKATQDLSAFNLDFIGFTIDKITVNGAAATFSRDGQELKVKPAAPVDSGSPLNVTVDYSGKPAINPERGIHKLRTPWAIAIAGEPWSCSAWYPCNEHPLDKATFHLEATVPAGAVVVSNGTEGETTTSTQDGKKFKTYRWNLDEPTTTYLTTVVIDQLTVRRSKLADGTPVVNAFSPKALNAESKANQLPRILDFLSTKFGPYPAPTAGGIYLDTSIGFALETYGRPIYSRWVDVDTIVHENGHQWFGDNVAIKQWKDICLSECFASYSSWLWDEHNGTNLRDRYRNGVNSVVWSKKLYDMGANNEFDGQGVYTKGQYMLHALRNKVGDDKFFAALKKVQSQYAGGNMSIPELETFLQTESGVDLGSFFDEWVYGNAKPSQENLYPGGLA